MKEYTPLRMTLPEKNDIERVFQEIQENGQDFTK